MKRLLVIKSSIQADAGLSNTLIDHFVEQWQQQNDGDVVIRDVAADAVPHLDGVRVSAFFTPAEQQSEQQQAVINYADQLLGEVTSASEIVIAVPLYNFNVPSQLKAWMDHLARAGVTFRYTETGIEGLLEDKPVTLLAARGGIFHAEGNDFQTPYLQQFFNFLGLTQLNFIYAEGLHMGEDLQAEALAGAKGQIDQLIGA